MKLVEKGNCSIEAIKNDITNNEGKEIVVKEFNKQGKLLKEFSGTIMQSYANLFIVNVKIGNLKLNKSFSYVDFLTNELIYEIL